jgi:transketolase C-terminal domain/subunit
MAMVGVQDRFGQSGKPPLLMEEYNITAADIVKAVKSLKD